MIVTRTVMEIPTGAIADLFGKKFTLILSFFIQAVGSFLMATAPNMGYLGLSIFIGSTGGALFSGTLEALTYDSLKEKNEEAKYSKVLANIFTFQLITMAIAATAGGFLYSLHYSWPFIASGIACLLGSVLALGLCEPAIETVKFSIKNFISQNKQGISQLFKSGNIAKQTIFLLSVAAFLEISDQVLNDLLAVEFGFSAKQLGIFVAILAVSAAAFSQLAPRVRNYLGGLTGMLCLGILIAITFICYRPWPESPWEPFCYSPGRRYKRFFRTFPRWH